MTNSLLIAHSQLTLWLNHTLYQNGLRNLLAPFAGQGVCLTCYQDRARKIPFTPLTAQFLVTKQGELFLATTPIEESVPKVAVQIVLPDFIENLVKHRSDQKQSALLRSLHLSGSAAFANVLAAVAQEWHWDIGEDISQKLQNWIPLPLADAITERFHTDTVSAWHFFRKTAQAQETIIAQWLSDEKAVLVSQEALQKFQEDLFNAREDLDRLDKRIQYLKKNMV